MTQEVINKYKEYFSAWVVDSYSVNVNFLAKYVDSKWVLWNCRLAFGPRLWEKDESWEVQTSNILAGNMKLNVQSIGQAESLLESAVNGLITTGNFNLSLPNQSRSYYLSTTEYNPIFFSHSLKVTVNQHTDLGVSSILSFVINEELRCGVHPFDGIGDLCSFLGFNENALLSDPFIELIVQPPADLDTAQCDMNDGNLKLALFKHPKLESSDFSIGLRCFPKPSIQNRFKIPTADIAWVKRDDFESGLMYKQFTDTVMVQVFLSVKGKIVRRHVIHDRSRATNLRYQLHNHFDVNLKKLKESLFSEKKPQDFEKAIGIVFNILGFSVCTFIDTDAPDIILSSPKGRVVLVECTLRTHDIRTKAGKLHHRKTEIINKIKIDFPWVEVVPVLVCNQPRDTITEDFFVNDNNIILFCQEDIVQALETLQLLSDPDDLLDKGFEKLEKNAEDIFKGKQN